MDFLTTRTESAIRKEIRGIRDSYHHYWDLLAELLQNSRDAINRKRKTGADGPFFIRLEINASTNTVSVFDNGIGIAPGQIHEMLAPGAGDKDGSGTEVGEKGVGLTYAVFSGNNFSIESRVTGQNVMAGKVTSAQNWLNDLVGCVRPSFQDCPPSDFGPEILFQAENQDTSRTRYPLDSYTKVSVGSITPPEGDTNIFALTAHEIKVLVRSRTAVGVTHRLMRPTATPEFDFYLSLQLPSGSSFDKVEGSYVPPHELVTASSRIELEQVRDAFVSKTDATAKRKFLGSKTVFATKRVNVDGWEIDVYGVMFPDNSTFRQLSRSALGIIADEDEISEGATLFQSGIFVGTKGMPTGLRIEPQPGGRHPSYYKRCFFFVESPKLRFDLGRKSLHYKHTRRLQAAAAELFSRFEDIAPFQGDSRAIPSEIQKSSIERTMELQAEWSLARNLAALNEPSIPYAKIPNSQEAAVAALFHELLGAGVLKGYRTLKTGYGSRYDLHASCTVSGGNTVEAVLEFKHDLDALVLDLEENRKTFSEINLLVAWDADEQRLKDAGFDLETISSGFFYGATHLLTVPISGIRPIEVILLRSFLDRKKSSA